MPPLLPLLPCAGTQPRILHFPAPVLETWCSIHLLWFSLVNILLAHLYTWLPSLFEESGSGLSSLGIGINSSLLTPPAQPEREQPLETAISEEWTLTRAQRDQRSERGWVIGQRRHESEEGSGSRGLGQEMDQWCRCGYEWWLAQRELHHWEEGHSAWGGTGCCSTFKFKFN